MGCDRAAWISRECQIWILPNRNCLLQGRAGTATCSTRTSAYIVFAQQGGEAADRHEPAVGRVAQKRLLGLVVSACLSATSTGAQPTWIPLRIFNSGVCYMPVRLRPAHTTHNECAPDLSHGRYVFNAASMPCRKPSRCTHASTLQSHSLGMEKSCCGATTLAELSVLLRIRLTW